MKIKINKNLEEVDSDVMRPPLSIVSTWTKSRAADFLWGDRGGQQEHLTIFRCRFSSSSFFFFPSSTLSSSSSSARMGIWWQECHQASSGYARGETRAKQGVWRREEKDTGRFWGHQVRESLLIRTATPCVWTAHPPILLVRWPIISTATNPPVH